MNRTRQPLALNDAFLGLDELASYSGLGRRTLEEYLRDVTHPLPFYRFGTRIVVKQSEFDEWARRFRVQREAYDAKAHIDAKLTRR